MYTLCYNKIVPKAVVNTYKYYEGSRMKKKKQSKRTNGEPKVKIELKALKHLFLVLLFIAPLNNGMFFEPQFLPLGVLTGAMLFYIIKTQGEKIKFSIPELLLLLLCGSYFLSFLGSVALHQAYLGFLKYIFYFAACFLTAYLWGKEERDKKIVLFTIIGAITVGTIITFLVKAQILDLTGFVIGRRFSSTFQYANTYAAVLAALLPLIAYLYLAGTNKWGKFPLLATWFVDTVAFYATLSRGALLVYLPALLLFLILLEKKHRWLALGNLILINALGVVGANYIMQNSNYQSLLVLLAGLVVVLLFNLPVEKKVLRAPIFTGLIIVILLAGGIFAAQQFPDKLSLSRLNRLTQINLETGGVASRLYFYEDAYRLFQAHWLIGTGAGGWGALYKTMQGHLYDSSEVHSSILQIMVESGLIGTALFLAVFGYLFLQQICRRTAYRNSALSRLIFLGILVLLAHSLIDFDLTVTAVSMYLFVLVGLLAREHSYRLKSSLNKSLKIVSLLMAAVLLISTLSMEFAHLFSRQSIAEIEAKPSGQVTAIAKYERDLSTAQRFAFLNPRYPSYLGQIKVMKGLQQNLPQEIEAGLQILERAIELEPTKYEPYLTKAQTLVQLHRRVEAVPYFEKIIDLMPMQHTGYEFTIENYVQLALETGDSQYLDLARGVYSRAAEQMQKVEPPRLRYWQHEELTASAYTNFHAGVTECVAGDFVRGAEYLTLALKNRPADTLREEINAWLAVAQEKQGLPLTVKAEMQKVSQVRSIINSFMVKSEEKQRRK